MSSHLVIGASGLVGTHLLRQLAQAGLEVAGTFWHFPQPGLWPLDVRDGRSVEELAASLRPQVIYVPAGFTHVDRCETEAPAAYAVNVAGLWNVIRAANRVGACLVYFSSDYVFDGQAGPYDETAPPRPLSEYGRQKVLGELGVALLARDYLIVRTTVVYGWEVQGKNFVLRLLSSLREGKPLRVPHDQVGTPTYGPNLAAATIELAMSGGRGLFHIAGPERVSRYEFACAAARAFHLPAGLIQAVATAELGQAARRPLQAGLRVERVQGVLSTPLLGYREGLAHMASAREEADGWR